MIFSVGSGSKSLSHCAAHHQPLQDLREKLSNYCCDKSLIFRRAALKLPPIVLKKRCTCGHLNTAIFPLEVTASVQARTSKQLRFISTNINSSPTPVLEKCWSRSTGWVGSLYHFNLQAYQALEDTQAQIKAALKQQSLIHADESGIRVEGCLH